MLLESQTLFRRRLTRAITLPLVLLLSLSGVSIWQITWLLSALRWVDHSDLVISQANSTQKLLLDMETGVRGYLLTGKQEFLEPYEQASLKIDPSLLGLKHLVADNSSQVQRVIGLMAQSKQWEQQNPPVIALERRGKSESLRALERRKQSMDQMRRQIAAFISVEEQLRNQRSRTAQQITQGVILSSLFLTLGIGAVLAYFIRRQILQVTQSYEDALQTAQLKIEEARGAAIDVQRGAQRLAALHDIDQAILATKTDAALIRTALTQLRQTVPHQQAFVAVFDLATRTAQVLAGSSYGELSPPEGAQLAMTDFAPQQSGLHRIRYVKNLTTAESCPSVLVQLRAHGFRSCLCIPLLVENTLIGELNLAADEPAAFDGEAQEIVGEVAAQLAIALQQSRLRKQLQTSYGQLQHELAERQQAEIELRSTEQQFRSTFNQAAVGIAHVSPNGQWLRVNQKLCEIVGYTREELLQRTFQDITYPDDLDIDLVYVRQMLVNEIQTYSMEKRYVRKDNSLVWINLTVSLVREASGEPRYFISVVEDISDRKRVEEERKQAEEELRQLNLTLEQRVAERTTALQEAIEGLEAFSYSASHDLRAPLRAMQGLSQALLEDYGEQLDHTAQLYAQEIAASARQADQLVTELLNYGRLSRTNITVQPLNLTQLVTDVLMQIEDDIRARKAQVTVENPLPEVIGNYTLLMQVILNLVANAVKFVPDDRQPQVRIWAEHRSGWVRLWIEDNGIGIAPEYQEQIFQAFERLHSNEEYPGTGIGLAIVRKGIERMGGQVGVESALGQGSRFWIELHEANGV